MLPKPSGYQTWDTAGKRYVHIEETKFVARHFLRNAIRPQSTRALVLSGTDPALTCLPWAMSGLATEFTACEVNPLVYSTIKKTLQKEVRKIKESLPEGRKFEINVVLRNVLREIDYEYGIIDLDFCNNRIRTEKHRDEILSLLDSVSPSTGPFVLRTTLHLGRANNSREDVERHVETFEEELRNPGGGSQRYKIRAHDMSPYQSSLPMVSLIWILERRRRRNQQQSTGERK